MPAGDCNSFSSLHNKLSAAAISRSHQETEPVQLNQYFESDKVEIRINGGHKRPLDSIISAEDVLHNTAKRPRISTLPIPTAVSPGLFTVKAHLPPQDTCAEGEDTQEILPSDPSELFSCSSQISPSNHTAIRVIAPSHVSTTLPSSSPNSVSLISSSVSTSLSPSSSSIPLITKATSTSSGSSTHSPYVHISCPSAKQQTGHNTHVLNSNPSLTSPLSLDHSLQINAINSNNQTKPQMVAVAAGGLHPGNSTSAGTTTGILPPLISGPGVSVGTHRFVLAGPGTQTILAQQGAGPGTALLLAAGAAAGNHRILVRHPSPAAAVTQKQIKQSKINRQAAAPTAFRSLLAPTTTAHPATIITKPTEVKVSRQLFHDATRSSSTSSLFGSSKTISLLTNGKAPASSVIIADPSQSEMATAAVSNPFALEASGLVGNHVVVSKEILPSIKSITEIPERIMSSCNKTLETPPSGQQFVTSPNKSGLNNSHIGISVVGEPAISDMDVMDLELPVVDDIGSTLGPTPTDSFNDSFASTSSSVVTTMIAGTHFLSHSQVGSVADSLLASHKQNGDVIVVTNSKISLTSPTHNSLPNGNDSSALLINNSLKPAVFSSVKVNANHAGTGTAVVANGSLFSQSIKSGNTSLDTSLSELQFSDHAEDLPPEAASAQFSNGDITPTDHSTDISSELETVDAALTQEIHVNNPLTGATMEEEMEQQGIHNNSETLSVTDNSQQLILSEDTNIYQTEDGIFIQSSNGNTYQLQGAQGLSLEAVQALLSGTIDQLAS